MKIKDKDKDSDIHLQINDNLKKANYRKIYDLYVNKKDKYPYKRFQPNTSNHFWIPIEK